MTTRIILSLATVAFLGCSGSVTDKTTGKGSNGPLGSPDATDASATWNAYAVETSDDLPQCDESRKGQLFYVESEESFRVCRSNGWAEIDLKGADGADGKDGKAGKDGAAGATGATGAPGADGTNGTNGPSGVSGSSGNFDIVAKLACSTLDPSGDWWLKYSAIEFSNHMVFVTCVASTSETQVSYSTIYASSQNGAFTGACSVTWDLDGDGSFGSWEFTYDPLEARYDDAGSASHNYTVPFDLATDCTTIIN